MTTPQQQAPGCFGAASVFSMDSNVCQACVAFNPCSDAAFQTLEVIKDKVNVSDILKKHQAARLKMINEKPAPVVSQPIEVSPIPVAQPKPIAKPIVRKTTMQIVTFEPSEADKKVLALIGEGNSKTHSQAVVLCKQNKINAMREALPKGINPFADSTPAFMSVVCDMLLNGGLTKATLKARFMEEFSWQGNTAGSHVAMSCAMLLAFGIAKPLPGDSDAFVLNPALSGQNKV